MTKFVTFYLMAMTVVKEASFGFYVSPSERFCDIRRETATIGKSNS